MNYDSEPKQTVSWRQVVHGCSNETRRVARMWLYYTLFYWLIPTVIAIVGLSVAKKPLNLLNLVIHGEFLIYAITLTAGSTRLISKDAPNSGPFINRQAFNLWSQIMIFPAIFVYGLLRYIAETDPKSPINTWLIVVYSVILLAGAFYFSYAVFIIDAQRSVPGDLQRRTAQAIKHSPDRLIEQFDQLEKQDAAAPQSTEQQPEPRPVQAVVVEEVDVAETVADTAIVRPPIPQDDDRDHLEDGQ